MGYPKKVCFVRMVQKGESIMYSAVFTKSFILSWKKMLKELYSYEDYMEFLIVPSVLNSKTLSYAPLLNYTDRLSSDISDLYELAKDNDFQIRVINSKYKDFLNNDTVTMRLDLSSNYETVFKKLLHSKCRNQVRKAQKSTISFTIANDQNQVEEFYALFKGTMKRYGTPVFSKKLFNLLVTYFKASFVVARMDNIAVAALVLVYDKEIAWVPWAASNEEYRKYCPNHLIYSEAIKKAIDDKKTIFDFGRSSYAGNTYKFKAQWGAKPVKIDVMTSRSGNVYEKYKFASMVWKYLPNAVTDFVGPKLCKYLPDL